MNWELILSIAGFVTGGGGLLLLFSAGRRVGELETKLAAAIEAQGKLATELEEVKTGRSRDTSNVGRGMQEQKDSLRKEMEEIVRRKEADEGARRKEIEEAIRRIHERLDSLLQGGQGTQDSISRVRQQVEVIITGIQSQKSDWETLRDDVRGLLRAEAANAVEVANIKKRLDSEEERVANHAEKLAATRADVDRLLRDERPTR